MIEFKPYESKPVTRHAFQVTDTHTITKSNLFEATYYVSQCTPDVVQFKAYE